MRRYLELLFSHKSLFLVPLIATPVIALIATYYAGRDYEVSATAWVQLNPYLSSAGTGATTPRSGTPVQTPNQVEAQSLREWLQTESFRREAMERVGLMEAIRLGHWPVPTPFERLLPDLAHMPGLEGIFQLIGWVRPNAGEPVRLLAMDMFNRTVAVTTEGTNLIRITYTGKEPFLGKRLIEETLTLYNEKTQTLHGEVARRSIEYFAGQAEMEKQRLDQASTALQQFLQTHPAPLAGQSRPPAEAAALSVLETSYRLELSLYESALRELERVRVEAQAKASPNNQVITVVDPPLEPETATTSKGAAMMAILFGLLLGALIGMVPILLFTWQDTTIRTLSDVQSVVRAPLYARAPQVPTRGESGDALRRSIARRLAQP